MNLSKNSTNNDVKLNASLWAVTAIVVVLAGCASSPPEKPKAAAAPAPAAAAPPPLGSKEWDLIWPIQLWPP